MEDIKNQIKDKEFYEKIYCEFFGISKFDTEGTTQNESVIRFAQFVSIVDWAEKINKKIKWEFPQTWIPVEEKLLILAVAIVVENGIDKEGENEKT